MEGEGSSSTSFQLTSGSSGPIGLPSVVAGRDSSSESSSAPRKQRPGPYPPRPVRGCSPLPGEHSAHSAGMRDQQVVGSPSSGGSMPSLIDMSQHSGDVGMEPGDGMNQLRGDQTLNYDQRSVNFDQRSVSVEHHTHGVNQELLTNMTVAAASAELRAQATQEVAGLREAAISAASDLRAEAVQAVASARVETTQRLQHLLELSQRENQLLREQFQAHLGQVQKEQSHETSYATGFSQMNVRLQSIESQLERLERKMDTHQEYIQELWLNQAPVPDISCPGPQTPVVRLQDHDLNDDDLFGAPDPTEGSQSQADDLESRSLRTKDLHHLKLPNLPDSASHFRSWKNAVRTVLLSFDHSQEGHLTPWLNQAFQLRGQEAERLKLSSDSFPRMDRVLASVLCRQEVLKTSFGLRIQSYVESCESEGIQVRGRFIINLISKEFDTSVASGAITSSLELFQLPIPQDSAAALKQRDKAVYILSQLSAAQRPGEELMSQWIYTTLKKHPLMRRVMDRYLDSPLGSSERSFATMWDGVERALLEAQHDANAQSIRDDLKRGPMVGKKPALPGHKGDGKSKDSPKHAKQDGKDKPSGKGQGSGNRASTSPDKRKKASTSAKEQGKGKAAKVPTAEEKAKSPCIYHVKGRCMRGDSCPYDHTSSAPQPKAKASSSGPGLVAKAAAVAIVATPSAATAVPSTSTMCLDVVGDTGAGENLASIEALRRQGLDVGSFITQASHPVRFLTGGGQRTGESTLGFWSDEFQRLSNFYLLPQCPVALSIGQLVETDGYSFVWHPNKLPMLIPPSTSFDYQLDGPVICADRIEHHVPMFRLTVECTYGLPASSSDVPFGGVMVMKQVEMRLSSLQIPFLNPSQT